MNSPASSENPAKAGYQPSLLGFAGVAGRFIVTLLQWGLFIHSASAFQTSSDTALSRRTPDGSGISRRTIRLTTHPAYPSSPSRFIQLSNVEHLVFHQGLNFRFLNNQNGDGFSNRIEHFERISIFFAFASPMSVNNCGYVSSTKSLPGKAFSKGNTCEQFIGHHQRSFGCFAVKGDPEKAQVMTVCRITTARTSRMPCGR